MPDGDLRINTTVNADGVQSGVDQTVEGLKRVETATDAVAEAAKEAAQTTTQAAAQGATGARTLAEGAATAGEATQNLGEISEQTAAKMAQLKISEDDVAAAATQVGASLEVTARAMIQIKSADLSDEIARVRDQLQALGSTGTDSADAITQGNQESIASTDDLSSQMEWLGDDLTDNKEKGAKMVEEFGSMRESRRIAIELFEVMQGGGETIAGLTGILRTLILTGEMLNPELAAITAIGLALAGVFALHGQTKKSTDDLKESSDSLADAMNRVNEKATDDALTVATRNLKAYFETQNQVLENEREMATVTQNKIADQKALSEATTKLTLANLELQKQQELGSATSQADRDSIEARYKAREAQVTGAKADDQFALQKQALESKRDADSEQLRTLQSQQESDQKKLDNLEHRAASTADRAQSWGDVSPDATGSYKPAIAVQEQAVKDALAEYQKAQESTTTDFIEATLAKTGGKSGDIARAYLKSRNEEITAAQSNYTLQSTKLADVRDADEAQRALEKDGAELRAKLAENQSSLDKLTASLDRFATQMQTAETNYAAQKTQEITQQQKDQEAAQNKTLKDDANTRKIQRENDQQALQNQLDVLPQDSPARAALEKQLAQSKADQLEDEKLTKIDTGEIPAQTPQLDASGKIVLGESPEAKSYDLKAQGEIAKTTGAEDKGQKGDLTQLAAQATAAVRDSKHPELEEELKNLLTAAKNDPQARILALLQVLAQTMAASHGQNTAQITNLEKELHDLQAQVNRQAHP